MKPHAACRAMRHAPPQTQHSKMQLHPIAQAMPRPQPVQTEEARASEGGKSSGPRSPAERIKADRFSRFDNMPMPTPSGQSKLLESLPRVEKRGFDVEAKLFNQMNKEFELALSKTSGRRSSKGGSRSARGTNALDVSIDQRSKPTTVGPLLSNRSMKGGLEKLSTSGPSSGAGMEMNKRAVLPSISTVQQVPDECSSQRGGDGELVRTVSEVHAMLPEEYKELKQMMELHRDLKSQMARNKEQISRLQESGDGGEMMDLLRQQASHVVMMMKDVLSRMEEYPEELWALYGAVEAYEQCSDNMNKLIQTGAVVLSPSADGEQSLGPTTVPEFEEALVDIYSHILGAVQNFLAVVPADGEDASRE